MEKNGQLKVDEYLRVEGHQDIYAVGDCCNSKDIKLAFTAGMQGGLVASNIKARLAGTPEKAWNPGEYNRLSLYLQKGHIQHFVDTRMNFVSTTLSSMLIIISNI